jgi:hypothetical protein
MAASRADDGREEMRRIAVKLAGLRDDLRVAVGRVSDPRARATLETGAEVLGGLRQAFVDYGEGAEEAWRR